MSSQAVLSPPSPVAPAPVTPVVVALPDPVLPRKYTVEEYVALERRSEIRHEYVEGEIIPMPGTSLPHNEIAGNIHTELNIAFREKDCRVYMESIRVRVSPVRYRYPDVVALCGEPITDNANPPALLNPNVIFEVLSPSTEENDRNNKYLEYSRVETLTDYVMISQDRVSVFHCTRIGEREWNLKEWVSLSDTLNFASLGVSIKLEDIYRRINFA